MIKYIIFNDNNRARALSFRCAVQNSKRACYAWSFLTSLDGLKSCLVLEYIADYIDDFTGQLVKSKCTYNDFKALVKNESYTEADTLDSNWNLENI